MNTKTLTHLKDAKMSFRKLRGRKITKFLLLGRHSEGLSLKRKFYDDIHAAYPHHHHPNDAYTASVGWQFG